MPQSGPSQDSKKPVMSKPSGVNQSKPKPSGNNNGNKGSSGNNQNESGQSDNNQSGSGSGNLSGGSNIAKPPDSGSGNSGNSKPSNGGNGDSPGSKPSNGGNSIAHGSKPSNGGNSNSHGSKPSNAGSSNSHGSKPSVSGPGDEATSNAAALLRCKEKVTGIIPRWILQLNETYAVIEDFISGESSPQHRSTLILSNPSSFAVSNVVPEHSSTSSTPNTGFVNSTFSTKSNSKHDFSLNTTNIDFMQYLVRDNSTTKHYPTSAITNLSFMNSTVSSKSTSKHESNIFSTSTKNSNTSRSNYSSKGPIEKRQIKSSHEHKTDSFLNGMRKITGFNERNVARFKRMDKDQTATRNSTRNNWFKKNVHPVSKKAQDVSADGNVIRNSGNYKVDSISYDKNSAIITIKGNANISRLIINYNNKQRDQFVIDISTMNITKASNETQVTDENLASYVKRVPEFADGDFVVRSHASQYMIPEHHQSELRRGKFSKDRKKQRFSKMAGKNKKILHRKRKTKMDAHKHSKKFLANTREVQGHKKKKKFGSKRNGKVYQKSARGIIFDKESGNLIIPVNSSISTIIINNGDHASLIIINPDNTISVVDDYLNSDIPSRQSSSQTLSLPSTLPETQGAHHTQPSLVFSKSETENLETIISNGGRPTQANIIGPITSKGPDFSYLQTSVLVPPIPVSKETVFEMTTDLLHNTEAVLTAKLPPASKTTTEKVTAAASLTKSIVTEMRPSSTILEAITSAINKPVLTATLTTIKIPRTTEQEIDIDVEKAITTKESHIKASATTAMPEKAPSVAIPSLGIVTEKLPTIPVPVTTLVTDVVPTTIMPVEIVSPKAPKTTLHGAVTSAENRHSLTSHRLPETTVTIPAIVSSVLSREAVTPSKVPEAMVTGKEAPSTAPYVTMTATGAVQMTAPVVIVTPWKLPNPGVPITVINDENALVSTLTPGKVPITMSPIVAAAKDKIPPTFEHALTIAAEGIPESTILAASAMTEQLSMLKAPAKLTTAAVVESKVTIPPVSVELENVQNIGKSTVPLAIANEKEISSITAVTEQTSEKTKTAANTPLVKEPKTETPATMSATGKVHKTVDYVPIASKEKEMKTKVPVELVTTEKALVIATKVPEERETKKKITATGIASEIVSQKILPTLLIQTEKESVKVTSSFLSTGQHSKTEIAAADQATEKGPQMTETPTEVVTTGKILHKLLSTAKTEIPAAMVVTEKIPKEKTPVATEAAKQASSTKSVTRGKALTPQMPDALLGPENEPSAIEISGNELQKAGTTKKVVNSQAHSAIKTTVFAEVVPIKKEPTVLIYPEKIQKSTMIAAVVAPDKVTTVAAPASIINAAKWLKTLNSLIAEPKVPEVLVSDIMVDAKDESKTPVPAEMSSGNVSADDVLPTLIVGAEVVPTTTPQTAIMEGKEQVLRIAPTAPTTVTNERETPVPSIKITADAESQRTLPENVVAADNISMKPVPVAMATAKEEPNKIVTDPIEIISSTKPVMNMLSLSNSTMIGSNEDVINVNISTTKKENTSNRENSTKHNIIPVQVKVQVTVPQIHAKKISSRNSSPGKVTIRPFKSSTKAISGTNDNQNSPVPVKQLESLISTGLVLTEAVKSLANNRLPVSQCPTSQITALIRDLTNNRNNLQTLDKLSLNLTELSKIKRSILDILTKLRSYCIHFTGNNSCSNNENSTSFTTLPILNNTVFVTNKTLFPRNYSSISAVTSSKISTSSLLNNSAVNNTGNIINNSSAKGSINSTTVSGNIIDNSVVNNNQNISTEVSINSSTATGNTSDNSAINNTADITRNSSASESNNRTMSSGNTTGNSAINNTVNIIRNSSAAGSINSTTGSGDTTENSAINNTINIIRNSSAAGSINSTTGSGNTTGNSAINNTVNVIENSSAAGSINSTLGSGNTTGNRAINNK
ncbi:uncharacterized protein [Macrobrachium rosenbergii]|uniref:uncharacterized protein isoform X2 n=1 Tax=Macrobrachium rosenbergii TaxID=79674 RepID=UPI0034D4E317